MNGPALFPNVPVSDEEAPVDVDDDSASSVNAIVPSNSNVRPPICGGVDPAALFIVITSVLEMATL